MPARPPGVWRAQGSLPSSARAAPGRSCTCSQGGGRVAGGAPVGGGARGGAQHAAQRRDGGTPRTLCRGRGAQVGTALDSGQGACTTLAPPLLLSPPAQPADGGGQPGRPRGALGPGQAVFRGRWVVGGGGGGARWWCEREAPPVCLATRVWRMHAGITTGQLQTLQKDAAKWMAMASLLCESAGWWPLGTLYGSLSQARARGAAAGWRKCACASPLEAHHHAMQCACAAVGGGRAPRAAAAHARARPQPRLRARAVERWGEGRAGVEGGGGVRADPCVRSRVWWSTPPHTHARLPLVPGLGCRRWRRPTRAW